jgi:hypothetical protein
VPVQSPLVRGNEQWSVGALADGQVDRAGGARASGMVMTLPPLRVMTQGAVSALQAQVLDVRAGRLRYP